MKRIGIFALVLIGGLLLGWGLLAGFCSVPGITYSNACGHNAVFLLPPFIVGGTLICWIGFGRLLYFRWTGGRRVKA
jgi:hypothetical protein